MHQDSLIWWGWGEVGGGWGCDGDGYVGGVKIEELHKNGTCSEFGKCTWKHNSG